MVPRTPAQFSELRETRRMQILQAALELFASEGYGHCTIANLASHAGISKGLMYNYFESKEALLESLIEYGLSELMDLFDPDHDGILEPEELEQFIRKVFTAIRERQQFWVLFITVILQPRVKEYLKNKPIAQAIQQFISMLLVYFEKKGFEDPNLEVMTLSALIEGFGILLIYAYPVVEFPADLMDKYEERIISMYR